MKYKVVKYIKYLLRSQSNLYLHSPFVYNFYCNVIQQQKKLSIQANRKQKNFRSEDNQNNEILFIDFIKKNYPFLGSTDAFSEKIDALLFRLICHYNQDEFIVINDPAEKCIMLQVPCVEQNERAFTQKEIPFSTIMDKKDTIKGLLINISTNGNQLIPLIDSILAKAEPSSIIVLANIYENREATDLWEKLQSNGRVSLTLDLFEAGVVFFTPMIKRKQHFVLKF
jgi:hypothetical protein